MRTPTARWKRSNAPSPVAPAEVQAGVVELDDAGDEAVHADGHEHRDAGHHRDPRHERRVGDDAERDHDDLRRQDEVGADRALDLLLLQRDEIDGGIGERRRELRR